MHGMVHRPSPGMMLALLALAVSSILSLTAIRAAGPGEFGPEEGSFKRPVTTEYVEELVALPKGGGGRGVAECSQGLRVIGGGYHMTSGSAVPLYSYPTVDAMGWAVHAVNRPLPFGKAGQMTVFAVCAKARIPLVP